MKTLRSGFSTGSCAAAAAKAAAMMLCGVPSQQEVEIPLPDGSRETLPLLYAQLRGKAAEAAVRKDAGDDPDVTDGASVVVSTRWASTGDTIFQAGEGVGTVTLPGLSVPPGEPAINPVPRSMIRQAIAEITDRPLDITVSIPGGSELAEKTFNPRLGIQGGLSILGTSGRVRPFSAKALRCALLCTLDVAAANGITTPIMVPGRIGKRAAEKHFSLTDRQLIEISNEWGILLEHAAKKPFQDLLLLGHPGKLAKLAEQQWDTHSSRSPSALPIVSRLFQQALSKSMPELPTVEGVFAALPEAERKTLGNCIALEIRKVVRAHLQARFPLAVVLTDMKAGWLGSAGDLSPWQ